MMKKERQVSMHRSTYHNKKRMMEFVESDNKKQMLTESSVEVIRAISDEFITNHFFNSNNDNVGVNNVACLATTTTTQTDSSRMVNLISNLVGQTTEMVNSVIVEQCAISNLVGKTSEMVNSIIVEPSAMINSNKVETISSHSVNNHADDHITNRIIVADQILNANEGMVSEELIDYNNEFCKVH
jgi:hypothetical protein